MTLSQIASAQDNIVPPSVSAPRAVLLDPKTKQLLFSKAPDQRALQGSVAKLMTAYVTFWAIREGLVSLNDQVPLSLRDTQRACTCMKSKTILLSGTQLERPHQQPEQDCAPSESLRPTDVLSGLFPILTAEGAEERRGSRQNLSVPVSPARSPATSHQASFPRSSYRNS